MVGGGCVGRKTKGREYDGSEKTDEGRCSSGSVEESHRLWAFSTSPQLM